MNSNLERFYQWSFLWRLNAVVCAFNLAILVGGIQTISFTLAVFLVVNATANAVCAVIGYRQAEREVYE